MSIYSIVTEQDLDNLRKIADNRKRNELVILGNRILKQTHDIKLAVSLSTITNKLDETSKKLGDFIKKSTRKLGNVIKESNTPQPAIENTPTPQPIEINEGRVYDVELENNLNKMTDNTGFF